VVLRGTTLARIDVVREVLAGLHQAVDEIDGEGLACELHLVGVGLDVLDGAGMHLVAIALVGAVVAGERHLGALGGELWSGERGKEPCK